MEKNEENVTVHQSKEKNGVIPALLGLYTPLRVLNSKKKKIVVSFEGICEIGINVVIFIPLRPVVYGTGSVISSAAYYLPSYRLGSCPPIHRATLLHLRNQLVDHVTRKQIHKFYPGP